MIRFTVRQAFHFANSKHLEHHRVEPDEKRLWKFFSSSNKKRIFLSPVYARQYFNVLIGDPLCMMMWHVDIHPK